MSKYKCEVCGADFVEVGFEAESIDNCVYSVDEHGEARFVKCRDIGEFRCFCPECSAEFYPYHIGIEVM